jgi:hypothetical protein
MTFFTPGGRLVPEVDRHDLAQVDDLDVLPLAEDDRVAPPAVSGQGLGTRDRDGPPVGHAQAEAHEGLGLVGPEQGLGDAGLRVRPGRRVQPEPHRRAVALQGVGGVGDRGPVAAVLIGMATTRNPNVP